MTNPFGVRPVINASATLTTLGGSLMPPPVLKAMTDAAAHFVDLDELNTRVGERLAALTRNEAAYVTSGAAAANTLKVAACITDQPQAFPADAEVVMFASQRNGYDYSARLTGARILEIGPTADDLRTALAREPACVLWFANTRYAAGALPIDEVVRIARVHDAAASPASRAGAPSVPVIVDAAAPLPPVSTLWHYNGDGG